MKRWTLILTFTLSSAVIPLPLFAAEKCSIEPVSKSTKKLGAWIDRDNWLAPENLRIGLQSADSFMPLLKINAPISPTNLPAAPRQLELQKIKAGDPSDQQERTLEFLLATRLYADGVVALQNGKVISEKYWNDLSGQQPRLLLDGTRPLLSLMGVMAVNQAKFLSNKSVVSQIPALNTQKGLRKLSNRRLLEGSARFNWTAQEINDWQIASGWRNGKAGDGVRAWLKQPKRWEKEFVDAPLSAGEVGPEDDLLAWALTESYRAPLAQVFCETILNELRPENPVFWLTDAQRTELSSGLALSLRDFARLGQMLLDARNSGGRSKIPTWFIETLTASGKRKSNTAELTGLEKGSESRYGFVHLGEANNRIAILGSYGNSLYVDFDRQLVIAIYAAYPKKRSAGMLSTLERVWNTVGLEAQSARKR